MVEVVALVVPLPQMAKAPFQQPEMLEVVLVVLVASMVVAEEEAKVALLGVLHPLVVMDQAVLMVQVAVVFIHVVVATVLVLRP